LEDCTHFGSLGNVRCTQGGALYTGRLILISDEMLTGSSYTHVVLDGADNTSPFATIATIVNSAARRRVVLRIDKVIWP
jgi:hypothetical protein